jgi:hypothetical protein
LSDITAMPANRRPFKQDRAFPHTTLHGSREMACAAMGAAKKLVDEI